MGGLLTAGQLAIVFFITGGVLGYVVRPYVDKLFSKTPAPVKAAVAQFEASLTAHLEVEAKAILSEVLAKAGVKPAPVVVPTVVVSPVVVPPGITGPVGGSGVV